MPFNDGDFWMVVEDLVYQPWGIPADAAIIVPAGFVTDLASIPPPARVYFKNMGVHGRAAIVHDYLYWSQGCTFDEADEIFALAMFENQVPATDRRLIHRAVRLARGSAWIANQQTRNDGWTKWIPEQYRKVDPLATWTIVRQALKTAGVRPDPPISPRPAYCSAKRPAGVS